MRGGLVATMDDERRVLTDGAVLAVDGTIVAVDEWAALAGEGEEIDLRDHVLLPGLVDAHVHLTGPSLFPGLEPDESPLSDHFPRWVMPAHVHSTPEDERAAARLVALQMLRAGTTAFMEAGVCRFPDAVLDALADMPIRGAIGTWAADAWEWPPELAATTDDAVTRIDAALALQTNGLVEVRPNLIGHTGCSDELVLAAAQRARAAGTTWTLHMSAFPDDGAGYRERVGLDPLVHLDRLGALDAHAVVSHAIHLSDAEVEVLRTRRATVAYCPGASVRLATGVTRVGRHDELEHVALGTDTQNASNHLELLRAAATACQVYAERRGTRSVTAATALTWSTRGGARALGWEDRIGSLQPGKRADIVAIDPRQPVRNVEAALVNGSPQVRHVWVDGRPALLDGRVHGEEAILADAHLAGERVAARADLPGATGWLCDYRTS